MAVMQYEPEDRIAHRSIMTSRIPTHRCEQESANQRRVGDRSTRRSCSPNARCLSPLGGGRGGEPPRPSSSIRTRRKKAGSLSIQQSLVNSKLGTSRTVTHRQLSSPVQLDSSRSHQRPLINMLANDNMHYSQSSISSHSQSFESTPVSSTRPMKRSFSMSAASMAAAFTPTSACQSPEPVPRTILLKSILADSRHEVMALPAVKTHSTFQAKRGSALFSTAKSEYDVMFDRALLVGTVMMFLITSIAILLQTSC
mmetsp:Transcript_54782/g.129192  ORF Transcript_54782/g.129192 Transcript_54782/m.129192 type:complete len:255 (-) Transcript_54782:31-795(-)